MKKLLFIPAVAVFVLISACSKKNDDDSPQVLDPININLKGHDDMTYSAPTDFNVQAEQEVNLTLENVGSLPKESMGHNVVILKPGVDPLEVALAAFKAKDNDYIPQSLSSSFVDYTKLLGPGESDTITFTIDSPGVYNYLCTFPGHSGTMKGTITVK